MKWLYRIVMAMVAVLGLGALGFAGLFTFLYMLNPRVSGGGPDEGVRRIELNTEFHPKHDAQVLKRTWVLAIPNKYPVSELGGNLLSSSYFVDIRLSINLGTLDLKPNPNGFTSEPGWMYYLIALHNGVSPGYSNGDDICYDYQDLREKYNDDRRTVLSKIRDCGSPNCRYSLSYYGWDVEVLVDQNQYVNKEKWCAVTRDLLKKWTVKVEDMRRPEAKNDR